MNQHRAFIGAMALVCVATLGASARAADAGKLGGELTPLGGEKAANKEGTIPAWQGAEAPAGDWSWGKKRGDAWKHKGEKALFTIDAGNVDKYAAKLSPGQVALIKQVAGYRMDVYPAHRSCGAPDFVAENTKKNVGSATLNADGWSLKDAFVPGVPFPMPENGAQVMVNAKMRYRGVGINYKGITTSVSPRKGGSEWIRAGSEQTLYFPWGVKGSTRLSQLEPVEYYTYFAYNTPAALAGQALSFTVYLNAPAETFYYFPGQRRVRRMPTYAYDAPQIGMENQYTLDEPFVFNGLMDRFDWKLVGKKEIYVPYNVFGMYDFAAKLEDVSKPESIDPAHRRYELHRVWVVDATVKPGTRHTMPKRTFYVDEDSWNMLIGEDYDAQGKLAKVREGFLIPVYETGTCDASAFVQYNLNEGRYVLDMHSIGTGKDIQWVTDPNGPRFKSAFYTSDNLRAISDR